MYTQDRDIVTNVSVVSDEDIMIRIQELDKLIESGECSNNDYLTFIAYYHEGKSRGLKV